MGRSSVVKVDRVIIYPLHGGKFPFDSVERAIVFIEGYQPKEAAKVAQPFRKFEIQVHYTNKDHIDGYFGKKQTAKGFLRMVRSGHKDLVGSMGK